MKNKLSHVHSCVTSNIKNDNKTEMLQYWLEIFNFENKFLCMPSPAYLMKGFITVDPSSLLEIFWEKFYAE